jgi:hypothetical protein
VGEVVARALAREALEAAVPAAAWDVRERPSVEARASKEAGALRRR